MIKMMGATDLVPVHACGMHVLPAAGGRQMLTLTNVAGPCDLLSLPHLDHKCEPGRRITQHAFGDVTELDTAAAAAAARL